MTRIAMTGTIGAAVLVVALGLFYAVYQQDQDEPANPAPSTNNTASDNAPSSGGTDTTATPDSTGQQAASTGQTASAGSGTEPAPAEGGEKPSAADAVAAAAAPAKKRGPVRIKKDVAAGGEDAPV